ncbi:DUF1289 domain-containing protein [Vibrio aquaticus]|uniref:DUF1289 domain-containing protein n=1 Tax=Vibrio aquaticus TaxID=2496559 RepID=A0A3S0MJB9_9VIBR|nr:DUF1289 domain-containing protein [Vibrio aquaticus]
MDMQHQVVNPCIGVCEADCHGKCLGCGRSRQERYLWYRLSEGEKREILNREGVEPLLPVGDARHSI